MADNNYILTFPVIIYNCLEISLYDSNLFKLLKLHNKVEEVYM